MQVTYKLDINKIYLILLMNFKLIKYTHALLYFFILYCKVQKLLILETNSNLHYFPLEVAFLVERPLLH